MNVKLEAKPNHDYDHSDYRALINIKAHTVKVSSLREASQICRKFIDDNELGGGNWTGGDITDDEGDLIGYVSYNGRVWKDHSYPTSELILEATK